MKKNITLTGMMGAGKSLIAESLSQRLDDYVAVDTDSLVEDYYKQTIPDMFAQEGEEYFRDAETKIIDLTYQSQGLVVALGGGAFEREKNRDIIKNNSTVIYLKALPETLFERIKKCTNRPLLKSGFSKEDVAQILTKREVNYALAHYVIKTDGKTPDMIVKEILEIIND